MFYNKNGELVDEQIIKYGDVLEEVGSPYESGKDFQNWVVSAVSPDEQNVAVNDEVNLPATINDVGNADTTVTLKPKYGNLYYVTFHEYPSGTSPDTVQTIKIVNEGDSVVVGDVTAPNTVSNKLFCGWRDGNTDYPVYSNGALVQTTSIPNVRANKDLYPIFETAYWLRYVSGETGSRAEYVPSRFVLGNERVTQLPVPTRKGYSFAGWYTGSMTDDGKILYDDNAVSDADGKVTNPSSGLKLTADTTLYAQWEPLPDADYTVIFWRQKASDDKGLSDAEKTYDYAEHVVRHGETDSLVAETNADKQKSGEAYTGFHYARTVQNSIIIKSDGSTVIDVYYDRDLKAINFYYREGDAPGDAQDSYTYTKVNNPNVNNTYWGVLEDGSYVQVQSKQVQRTEVYYTYDYWFIVSRRAEYYGTFYVRRGTADYVTTDYNGNNLPPEGDNTTYYTAIMWGIGNGIGHEELTRRTRNINERFWYYTKEGVEYIYTGDLFNRTSMSGYPKMVTWTGLYGQSFDQYDYVWPDGIKWNEKSDGSGITQTFLGAFEVETNPYNLYDQGPAGTSTIYHYIQGLDGKYGQVENESRFTAKSSAGIFNFQNKFQGFTVSTYSEGDNGFSEDGGTTSATDSDGDPKQSVTINSYPLHVYHTRNKWKITYMSDGVEVKKSDELYYQASMEDWNLTLAEVGIAEKPHYTFTGWYIDATCTQKFSFSDPKGMPNANVVVYAGWENAWYQVIVDPNGGEITPNIGATYMWKQYNEKISRYDIVRTYIDDENGDYKYVYVDGKNDPDGNITVRTATYELAEEGYTGTKYRPMTSDDPAYVLVDWYVVDENDNMTDTPYDFNSIIEQPLTIRAKWRIAGDYTIVYNATNTVEVDGVSVTVSGTFNQSNPGDTYADGSRVIIQGAPSNVTPQYIFDGWYVADTDGNVLDDNGGSYYAPGDALILDAAAWSEHKVIYLRAHYTNVKQKQDPIPVTKLILDANGGTFANITSTAEDVIPSITLAADNSKVTIDKLHMNAPVELATYSANVSKTGDIFLGWSTDSNATEAEFSTDTKVGADNLPDVSNTLYAVWEHQYFYVFHSSTGHLEAVRWTSESVDLTDYVSSGNLYGGYFTGYGGYAVTDKNMEDAMAAAKGSTPTTVNVTDNTYDGTSLTVSSTRYWMKAQAGQTSGTDITPQVGDVYYLKEVPNKYLATNARWAYDWKKGSIITAIYLLTCIDDTNFTETGFIVTTQQKGRVVSKFSYQRDQSEQKTTIGAADLIAQRGYIGVVDGSNLKIENEAYSIIAALNDGNDVSVQPYWTTLDGVVISTKGYTFYKDGGGILTKDNLKYRANT